MRRQATSDYADDSYQLGSGEQSYLEGDESDVMSPPMDVDGAPGSALLGNNDNFRVVIRVRPPVQREIEGPRPFVNVVRIPTDHRSITLCEHLDTDDGRSGVYSTQTFSFDYVHDSATKQRDVYERSAQPAVQSVLSGYNATVIAYGQTGTGKTYSMEGYNSATSDDNRGIIPRSIEEIFNYIGSCRGNPNMRFLVRASYMQIYNEVISDLLKPLGKQLTVRHTKQRGVYIDGLSEWVVRSPGDVYGLMGRGTSLRATGSTKMSELSSRSHAMFIIIVEVMEGSEENPTSYKFGKLNIVDLAGSEKVRQTGVTGQRLEETKNINWSLHELGNVISALTAKGRDRHIPFRNSALTSALRDSLGGNCKTTLIACISPALESYSESLSTLKFANRAKNIKNDAVVNEDVDQGTLLRRYEKELKRLRTLLEQRGVTDSPSSGPGGNVDYGVISELEQGKRRAEEDREAALEALQESSRAHHEELITRKRLEGRIDELQSIVNGGHAGGLLGPAGHIDHGGMNPEDYAMRLDELDKERQVIEEDKAQVDRYKQLLLKQRDIMLNLTTRLNERDETILQLQEEIDAYDAHIQMLEDTMEANAVPISTRTEAQEYLRRIMTTPAQQPSGASTSSLHVVRYRSEGNPEHLLTSEEKIVELLMLKGKNNQSAGDLKSPPPASSADSDEKHHAMEVILRERVEAVALRMVHERMTTTQRDVESLKAKLLASEDKRRSLEYLVEMAKQQGGAATSDVLSRAKRYVDQEQESMRGSYMARIHALQAELDGERDQRRRLGRDMDRYRFDLQQLKASVDPTKRQELDRLWRSIEGTEDTLLRDFANSPSSVPQHHRDPLSSNNSFNAASLGGDSVGRVKSLEDTVSSMRQQQAQQEQIFREQLADRDRVIKHLQDEVVVASTASSASQSVDVVASKDREIASLTKNLTTHVKDRRALKTIMESRIKVKVDNILELFQQAASSSSSAGGGGAASVTTSSNNSQRMGTEIRALQNLVNASITAMES
jgi:hypothetical protein